MKKLTTTKKKKRKLISCLTFSSSIVSLISFLLAFFVSLPVSFSFILPIRYGDVDSFSASEEIRRQMVHVFFSSSPLDRQVAAAVDGWAFNCRLFERAPFVSVSLLLRALLDRFQSTLRCLTITASCLQSLNATGNPEHAWRDASDNRTSNATEARPDRDRRKKKHENSQPPPPLPFNSPSIKTHSHAAPLRV